jgi:outer membrane protein assembly factor BamB
MQNLKPGWQKLGFVLVILALLLEPVSALAEDWPMFRAGPARSGVVGESINDQAAPSWAFPTGGPVRSSPAVVGNTVYVGSDDGNIYAIDVSSGRLVWSTQTGGPVRSSPAIQGSSLFVGSLYGLVKIDTATGDLAVLDNRSPVDTSPVVDNGWVYFVANDGRLVGIDSNNLENRSNWDVSLPDATRSSPALFEGSLHVFSGGGLFIANVSNGLGISNFVPLPGGGGGMATPAIFDRTLYYVGVADQLIYAVRFDPESARLEQCYSHANADNPPVIGASPAVSGAGVVFMVGGETGVATVGPPPVDEGSDASWQLLPCGQSQSAQAGFGIQSQTAAGVRLPASALAPAAPFALPPKIAMSQTNQQELVSSPAVSGTSIVYVATAATSDGERSSISIWDYATSDPVTNVDLQMQGRTIESSPAIADGSLFVGGIDGYIYAVPLSSASQAA